MTEEAAQKGLEDQARNVHSRADFVSFVATLREEADAASKDWENVTLGDYLNALGGWLRDCPGYYKHADPVMDPDVPQWRVFADALLAATVYE